MPPSSSSLPSSLASSLVVPLWPDRARPSMRVCFPTEVNDGSSRPAMVVLRGGGYSTPFGSGAGAAEWAAAHGMVGLEVEYGTRASGDSYPQGYADAARALRLVRAHAAQWAIDPTRVGLMGFSAGGHLASLLSTQPSLHIDPRDELAPRLSARPDLVVLAYPVISFIDGYHPGAYASSVDNFFGHRDPDEPARRRFSSELHVTADHPPVFLWTTADDAIVPASHSTLFADACRRAGIPLAFTLYPTGPHGMGLALDAPAPVREWTIQLLEWLPQQWHHPR